MTITTSREVYLCPVLGFRVLQEPRDGFGIDTGHIFESLIECGLICCAGCVPKERQKVLVFEFFVEVHFEMLETVTMRTSGENVFDSFEETFLTIGEENKSFVDERLKCMALNHG